MGYEDYLDTKKTEFESGILNKKIVSIKNFNAGNLNKIVNECKKRDFDYIVCQIGIDRGELINSMVNNGFRIFGLPVILKVKLSKKYMKEAHIRKYKKADLNELKKISKRAFLSSHWYNTNHLKKEKVDDLYIKWLENCCNGRAEIVLVYEENSKALGYVACTKKNGIGVIDLIAVSNKSKNRGIGKALINSAKNYFNEIGFKEMEVKTEMTNIAALNLYTQCGFRIDHIGVNINKWLE